MTNGRRSSRAIGFAAAIALIAVLYLAREVLMPVALAALLSFVLAPLATRLQPLVGRVTAVIAAVLLACGVLGGVTWLVAGQLTQLAAMVPQYRENIAAKLSALSVGVVEEATEAIEEIEKDVQAQRKEQKEQKDKEEQQQQAAREEPAPNRVPVPRGVPVPVETPADVADGRARREAPEPDPVKVQVVEPEPSSFELVAGAFGPLLGPLTLAGMVIVLVVFMLLSRQDLRDRIVRLMGRSRIGLTTQALDEAGRRVSRYLLMQTVVNALTGLAVAVGMLLLGVPGFYLWGLLSALLRFVPYVGPWIAAAMPVLVSLAVFDGWTWPLLVVGCFVVIELVSNNVFEPWLYGSSAGVSPLAVIVTAIFWTWLWGPVGLLLATPLTVCLVVIGKYVPQMRFVNILLGDEPVLEPHARFYQRLIARNQEEAGEVAEEFLAARGSLAETFDVVMLPALALVETDRDTEDFDEHRARRAQAAMREIVRDLGDVADRIARRAQDPDAKAKAKAKAEAEAGLEGRGRNVDVAPEQPPPRPMPELPDDLQVLALPASDEADELAAAMLQQLVRACGARCEVVPRAALTDGLIDAVQQHPADVVVVSAVPPSAVPQARHVHKRLRARFPEVPILIGLWTRAAQLEEARGRIDAGDDTPLVATLQDALLALETLARLRGARTLATPERDGAGA
jgi:predicted PurR-regulated permease PerM